MKAKSSSALTLTEVLTAIVAAGTLAAVLVPALSAGKETADKAVCRDNLRQVAMAMLNYTRDNDGILPEANWGQESTGWLYDEATFDPEDETPAPTEPLKDGQLWPYLENFHAYRCPTDWRDLHTPLFQERDQRLSSYVINGSVQAYSMFSDPLPLVDFRPDAILFWEADERTPFFYNDGSNFPTEGYSTRHIYGSHVAGVDGHVEFMSEAEWDAELDRRPGRLWNNPRSADGG